MVMKKITFRADAEKLELARRIAEAKGTTLEDLGEGRWKPTPGRPKRKQAPKSAKD
jgi:hypothetical protein